MNIRVLRTGSRKQRASSGMVSWGRLFFSLVVCLILAPTLKAADFTEVAPLQTGRFGHTATLVANGQVLVTGGSTAGGGFGVTLDSAEIYNPVANTWTSLATMKTARSQHTATLLPDGRVLVVGGIKDVALASAELYDPVANAWTPAANMKTARSLHTATLLAGGQVLVVGGENGGTLSSAEKYNPITNVWTPAVKMETARSAHTATLLPDGQVLVAGGVNHYVYLASVELYDPGLNDWSILANMHTARGYHTATRLDTLTSTNKNKPLVLVAGGWDGSALSSTERYDPDINEWVSLPDLNTGRFAHTATLLPEKLLLVVGGSSGNPSYPTNAEIFNIETWTGWASRPDAARSNHTATLLPDGRVLVTGGQIMTAAPLNKYSALSTVEIFKRQPFFSHLSPPVTGAPLSLPRFRHRATLLSDGGVLVSGGMIEDCKVFYCPYFYSSDKATIFNPVANTWTPAADLHQARTDHTATLLPGGQVLVAGGVYQEASKYKNYVYLASTEIYDAFAGKWTSTADLHKPRSLHTATLLADGRVMLVGGYDGDSSSLASTEIYDAFAKVWASAADLLKARSLHTATLLADKRVLVVGGFFDSDRLATVEVYDPKTNTWGYRSPLNQARAGHTATLLADGRVLVVGGEKGGPPAPLSSAEVYDPITNIWTSAADLNQARAGHTATLLADGRVLVAGGSGPTELSSAEIYDPGSNTWFTGAMKSGHSDHTATLLSNGGVLIIGTNGPNDWAEIVWCLRHDHVPPIINGIPSTLVLGDALTLTGTGFRDTKWNEASSGGTNSSATNYPMVQLRRLDNEQLVWLSLEAFTDTQYKSRPLSYFLFLPGPALATVFVNAVPSVSRYVLIKSGNVVVKLAPSHTGPVPLGTAIAFIATVTSGLGTPTGTVQFLLDGVNYGNPVPLMGGLATMSIASLPLGSHTISVVYHGDAIFAEVTADVPLTQEIELPRLFIPLILR